MIDFLLEGWRSVKYGGAQIAWASIVFGFELAIEKTRQAFAWILAKDAPAGTARDAYNAKLARLRLARAEMLLELQLIKMIADGTAALENSQKRLAALAKTCTDTQAKLGGQAIADEPALQIIVSTAGRFAPDVVDAAGASLDAERELRPPADGDWRGPTLH